MQTEKFTNIFDKAFTKSNATEPQFGKASYKLKKVSCNNQSDFNAACTPLHTESFQLNAL